MIIEGTPSAVPRCKDCAYCAQAPLFERGQGWICLKRGRVLRRHDRARRPCAGFLAREKN